jgi:hypothetical protein
MRINRRNLLWAMAGLVMTKLVGPTSGASLTGSDEFYGIHSPGRSSTEPGKPAWSTGEPIRL